MASQVARILPDGVSFFKGESPDDRLRAERLLRKKRRLNSIPPRQRQKAVDGDFRHPPKRASKGLKAEQAKYKKLHADFLSRPENTWCVCCTIRREQLGENIVRNQSVEIHHVRGRIGRLLCWVPGFRAFCNACRHWPHEHPIKARELNLLAPAHLWNVFPGDY